MHRQFTLRATDNMSGKRESTERYVVGARLLGEELKTKKQRKKVAILYIIIMTS